MEYLVSFNPATAFACAATMAVATGQTWAVIKRTCGKFCPVPATDVREGEAVYSERALT